MNESRLYRLFQPTHYDLHVTLQRQKRQFGGTVTIDGNMTSKATSIQLHARKLHVVAATIDGRPAMYQHDDQDVLQLSIDNLAAGPHRVSIEFEGEITDPMQGLYPCYYTFEGKPQELLATQFESHHARSVFPCVDEPEAKATFNLTLRTETDVTVLSNTPVKEQRQEAEQLVTSFETTPVMSTYLLAWIVGKLVYQEAHTKDGVTIRAYATPANQGKLSYAVGEATKCLEYFNDYFDLPYPMTKCDLIALPDFSAGAMENWGCITFRETVLLADEHSSTHTRQYITMVIAHELAHQWFGNLVTMKWWNDLWLNESFANLMEYVATDALHPDWNMSIQYYQDETMRAIRRDSLASVQKIQQEVTNPEEIETLFDPAIVYAKGGSLLSMLHAYIGADNFRAGLRTYLSRHRSGNTEANDLWRALSEASSQDVERFMTPWISQHGMPVLTVGVSKDIVNLRQHRFFSTPHPSHDQTVWPIPLFSDNQLSTDILETIAASVQTADNQPLLLNKGRKGYYLTMYDTTHLAALSSDVRASKLSVIDRLGLLSDSLNLSRAGLQPQNASLQLLEAYRSEQSQPVWGAISQHIAALKMFASGDKTQQTHLRQFVQEIAVDQFKRLGWDPAAHEPYFDTLLRPVIIGHMVYAEDQAVITKLLSLFEAAPQPSDIAADIRTSSFIAAARYGGQTAYQKLQQWHEAAISAELRHQIVPGICAAQDPQAIRQTLQTLTAGAVRLQDLTAWIAHLSHNEHARDLTWQWMQDNWQWIEDHYANDFHYTSFPKSMAAAFSRTEQLESYKYFFEPKLNIPALARTITQGIEDIEGRVAWRKRDGQAVAEYLAHYTSKKSS